MTIDSEITYLTNQLQNTREMIEKIGHLKSTEEGSQSSRFSAQYTELNNLIDAEHKLQARLNTLKSYTA